MATKYRVSQNSNVYGNYPAKNDIEAIYKAYNNVGKYYNFDFSKSFDIKHNGIEYATFAEVPNEK